MQSARRDIGGNQHAVQASAQSIKRGLALLLRAIAMQQTGGNIVSIQRRGNPARATARAREHQHAFARGLFQQM